MKEIWSQDGKGPQDAICDFLGSVGGSRASKEAFYNRLAKTADSDLPSEKLPVTVRTFDAGRGGSLSTTNPSGCSNKVPTQCV